MVPRLDRRFHDELTGCVGFAIEFGQLDAACVGASLVFDQQGVPPEVACWGARHLTLQCHLGASIDDLGKDVDRARHATASLVAWRSHVLGGLLSGVGACDVAMDEGSAQAMLVAATS